MPSPSFRPSIRTNELASFLFVVPVSQHHVVASNPELSRGSHGNHTSVIVNNFNLRGNVRKTLDVLNVILAGKILCAD
jgi:hypothetical protein